MRLTARRDCSTVHHAKAPSVGGIASTELVRALRCSRASDVAVLPRERHAGVGPRQLESIGKTLSRARTGGAFFFFFRFSVLIEQEKWRRPARCGTIFLVEFRLVSSRCDFLQIAQHPRGGNHRFVGGVRVSGTESQQSCWKTPGTSNVWRVGVVRAEKKHSGVDDSSLIPYKQHPSTANTDGDAEEESLQSAIGL